MATSSKETGPSPVMAIDDVTAISLISPNARELSEFYRSTLGFGHVASFGDPDRNSVISIEYAPEHR